MIDFPDPADDPETVTAAAERVGRAAALLAGADRTVRRCTANLAGVWIGTDADAAAGELRALAGLLRTGAAALSAASSAFRDYRDALVACCADVSELRSQHDGVLQERDLRVQRGLLQLTAGAAPEMRAARIAALGRPDDAQLRLLRSRFDSIDGELHAAARRLATALARANEQLQLSGPPTRLAVTQRFAAVLPSWGAGAVQEWVTRAVRAVESAGRPVDLRRALEPYAGWADVPAFATAFLEVLGPRRFGDLLSGTVPAVYDDRELQTLDAVLGLLGRILAAGTRAPQSRPWLRQLVEEAGADANRRRVGLGLALRHGSYGTGALAILVPALTAHPGDLGISLQQPVCDPLVGAMTALAGNSAAARRILTDRSALAVLLRRTWREDDGRALGAALAAGGGDADAQTLLQQVIEVIGADPGAVPLGISPGLGQLLGANVATVNRSLVADEAIALPGAGTRVDAVSLARTLMLAMRSTAGSAAIYAHQAAYAAATVAGSPSLAAAVDGLCENAGRLAGIHQRAIAAETSRADAKDESEVNADTWIRMAQFAAGLLPLPAGAATPVTGAIEGLALGRIARELQDELYRKPLQRRRSARHAAADRVIAAELGASTQFCRDLVAKAYPHGPPQLPDGLSLEQICRQAGAAGQNDVAVRLLPGAAVP